MINIAELVDKLKEKLNELPEDVKVALGGALSASTTGVITTVGYVTQIEPLTTLLRYLSTNQVATKEVVESLLNKIKHLFTTAEVCSIQEVCLTSKTANGALIKKVTNCAATSSNLALLLPLLVTAVSLTVETIRLIGVWQDICEAQAFLTTECRQIMAQIQERINQLPKQLEDFQKDLDPSAYQSKTSDERLAFHIEKSGERCRLKKLIKQIKKDIGKLEFQLDGKKKKLQCHNESATTIAAGIGFQGAILGASTFYIAASANPILATVSGITAILCGAAAGTGLYLGKKTAVGKINAIQEQLDELIKMRAELKKYNKQLKSIFDQFDKKLLEDAKNKK